jgi:hypothetical protein
MYSISIQTQYMYCTFEECLEMPFQVITVRVRADCRIVYPILGVV